MTNQISKHEAQQAAQAQRDAAISEALERLAACTLATADPGGLAAWAGDIRSALNSLDEPLIKSFTDMHDELFQTILDQDDELFRRVEQLKDVDSKILETVAELEDRTEQLIKEAAVADDENPLRGEATRLATDAEQLLVRIRLHREDVSTCLQEAFLRDRGAVD